MEEESCDYSLFMLCFWEHCTETRQNKCCVDANQAHSSPQHGKSFRIMQWNQLSPGLLLFLLFITWLALVLAQDDVIFYDGCSIEEYYNSLLSNNDFNSNNISMTLREDVTRTIRRATDIDAS